MEVDKRGLVSTIFAGLLFGTSVPVIKLGLYFIPPDTFVTLRFLFASALIVFPLQGRGWVQWDLLSSRQIWIIGFINALGYVLQFQGQLITSASNAALIISTAALMIPVLSLIYVHEKMGMRKIAGVLSGFIGIVLLVTRGQAVNLGSSEVLGDFLILGTAVTIALVFVLSKDLVEKKGGRPVTGGIILVTANASASHQRPRPELFVQPCPGSLVLCRFPGRLRNGRSVLFLHERTRIRLSNNFLNNSAN